MSAELKYRPDIDGLRAIAVLAVVGFHSFPGWVKGGFVGVDIFFVISGFLISRIVFSSLDSDNFSLLVFYSRRIRRIFPALIVVMLATFAWGWFLFIPIEHLGKHLCAGAGFISNFILWRESGYFDSSSQSNPLLHLWSLAIEEQFYIFWPLFLSFIHRKKWRFHLIILLMATSFLINVVTVTEDPSAAYYSPISRFWELILGGILGYIAQYQHARLPHGSNLLSASGFLLVGAGIVLVTKTALFPGWWALFPTLGTFMIIAAGSKAWLNRNILSNPLLVGIGLISYPLYLWHWPALFLARYYGFDLSSAWSQRLLIIASIVASFGLSWLTYLLLEKPIRATRQVSFTVTILGVLIFCTGLLGYAAYSSALTNFRFPPSQRATILQLLRASELNNLNKMFGERPCFIFDLKTTSELFHENNCLKLRFAGKPTVLLIGDSHSAALSLGLRPFLADTEHVNFLQISSGWCPPTLNDTSNLWCKQTNDLAMATVSQIKPNVVIVGANWLLAATPPYFVGTDYFEFLIEKINELKKRGAQRIVIIGQNPVWLPTLPYLLYSSYAKRDMAIPSKTHLGINNDSLRFDSLMKTLNYPTGTNYFSLKNVLCDDDGCLTTVGTDLSTDLIVWDDGHLTKAGAEYIVKNALGKLLLDLLKETY